MVYTMIEVANMFNVNKSTVCRWLQKGWIKSIPGSKKILITEMELEKFREEYPQYDTIWNRIDRIYELEHEKEELETRLKQIKEQLKKIDNSLKTEMKGGV